MKVRQTFLTWYFWKRKIGRWGTGNRTYGNPSSIRGGSNIEIGNNCRLNSGIVLNATDSSIVIGNNVTISSNSQIIAATYDVQAFLNHDESAAKHKFAPISIGNNVWICAGSIILPGVSVADNVVIGAGSVVTKSISEEYVIAAGNPCQIIKRLQKQDGQYDGGGV